MRSWLASASALSTFFALDVAALADFSAVVLAAAATYPRLFGKLRVQLQGMLCEHWPSPKHLQHVKEKKKVKKRIRRKSARQAEGRTQ
jgi:hypothetical protein